MSPIEITVLVIAYLVAMGMVITFLHRIATGRRLAEAQHLAETQQVQDHDAVDDPQVNDHAWLQMLRQIHDDDEAAAARARRKKENH